MIEMDGGLGSGHRISRILHTHLASISAKWYRQRDNRPDGMQFEWTPCSHSKAVRACLGLARAMRNESNSDLSIFRKFLSNIVKLHSSVGLYFRA